MEEGTLPWPPPGLPAAISRELVEIADCTHSDLMAICVVRVFATDMVSPANFTYGCAQERLRKYSTAQLYWLAVRCHLEEHAEPYVPRRG